MPLPLLALIAALALSILHAWHLEISPGAQDVYVAGSAANMTRTSPTED